MVTSVVRVVRLLRTAGAVLLVAGVAGGCADTSDSGRWFPEVREYFGECGPPGQGEGGCWWFLFTPAGVVDFTSGDDIAYRGDYRINDNRISVTALHHRDLELGLSADQDTLWLPHGGHILRRE